MNEVIVSNSVKCGSCGDEIYSAHTHDYKCCSCGSVCVDGGQAYLKRSYKTGAEIIETSIVMDRTTLACCLAAMKWADETGRNEKGKLYAILRALRDNGIDLSPPSN